MKKVFLPILLAVILVVAAVPCGDQSPKYPLGESQAQMSWDFPDASFSYFYETAHLVVEVEITRSYGSLKATTGFHSMLYRGVIKHCYKNITGEDVTAVEIVQDGTPEWTISDFPLFQTGDRLLLMLTPAWACEGLIPEKLAGYYIINGSALSAIQILESEDGDVCRTFLPAMADFPAADITPAMRASVITNIQQKYRTPSGPVVPEHLSYRTVPYGKLKEYIERRLL